jgi:hypothetical protein
MKCLNCDELKDKAYVSLISKKLTNHFSANPCVDCGETRLDVLIFSDWNKIISMIAEQEPWPKINGAIHEQEVVCANCHQLRISNKVGPWGVPTKKWDS